MAPSREYIDLEIRLSHVSGGTYQVYAKRQNGADANDTFEMPNSNEFAALVQELEKLDIDEDGLIQLGSTLFQALFRNNVRKVYDLSQGGLTRNQRLRIRLNIDPADPVATLAWEFLYDPDQDALALLDTSIVRYIAQPIVNEPLETPLPLKILLTGAHTPPELSVSKELAQIVQALAPLVQQGLVSVHTEEHITLDTLQSLLEQDFHVWHFVGHGGFTRDGRNACLLFEEEDGQPRRVPARELLVHLRGSNVRMIVLNACDTAHLATEPFRSIAPALIRSRVPAVVAMQFQIDDGAALAFADKFYQSLAAALPIDACVTAGRRAIMNQIGIGVPDWGIPVVYTRAPDGQLFKLQGGTTPPVVQPPSSGSVNLNIGNGNEFKNSDININNGGQASALPEPSERERELAALQKLRNAHKRTENALKLQAATFGISTPPHITIQIEDIEKEIARIERQISALGG